MTKIKFPQNNILIQSNSIKGQAAILIIFVVGMVALAIGTTLTKTGFGESIMGRASVGSTKAFYVANSGIEDAFYRMKTIGEESLPYEYDLAVDEGKANITIRTVSIYEEESGVYTTEREIVSVGKYDNFVRKIRVTTQSTLISPDFTRFIQSGQGGIEIGHAVTITSSGSEKVNIYSQSFVRGRDNGTQAGCDTTSATTNIDGNVYAYDEIEKTDVNGSGPCITGNAYAGNLKECRIFGKAYSDGDYGTDCPFSEICDSETDPDCKRPTKLDLPDIGVKHIENFLEQNPDTVYWSGPCQIGGAQDCSTASTDGTPTIGNMIIEGNLETRSNSFLYLSGPVWVKGSVTLESNQTISLDPANEKESSLIILADDRIIANSNTHFTSDGTKFLLMASKYENGTLTDPETICEDTKGNAITIEPNVQSILFYAINGCAYVAPTASEAFLGAILAQGVMIDNNVEMIYNPALKEAKFFLNESDEWEILSFTEE